MLILEKYYRPAETSLLIYILLLYNSKGDKIFKKPETCGFCMSRRHRRLAFIIYSLAFFLVSFVEERLWWPMQSPNKGRKEKEKGLDEREIRLSLLILDLKDGFFPS